MMKQYGHLVGIIFLNLMANIATMMFLFFILLPKTWSGYWLSVPTWVMITIVTGMFAHWYFHLYPPTSRDVLIAILMWIVVSYVVTVLYALLSIGNANFIVFSLDTYVQYALQAIAVGVLGYLARRDYASRLVGQ